MGVVPDDIKKLAFDYIYPDIHWRKFKISFNHSNPGYFDRIKINYPELSEYDIQLCAYILIGLKSEDLAKILHINTSSVNKSRNRLRKKLKVAEDISLVQFSEKI